VTNPPGYSYRTFCANVQALHGPGCWIQRTLTRRDGRTVPFGWLICDGMMDAHHICPKSLLKKQFPEGAIWASVAVPTGADDFAMEPERWLPYDWRMVHIGEGEPTLRSLADLLNDGRDGVGACRKHHDMVEARQVVIRRDELPVEAVEFATELGLGWFIESRAFDPPATNGGAA
jgi:hypothetical protein